MADTLLLTFVLCAGFSTFPVTAIFPRVLFDLDTPQGFSPINIFNEARPMQNIPPYMLDVITGTPSLAHFQEIITRSLSPSSFFQPTYGSKTPLFKNMFRDFASNSARSFDKKVTLLTSKFRGPSQFITASPVHVKTSSKHEATPTNAVSEMSPMVHKPVKMSQFDNIHNLAHIITSNSPKTFESMKNAASTNTLTKSKNAPTNIKDKKYIHPLVQYFSRIGDTQAAKIAHSINNVDTTKPAIFRKTTPLFIQFNVPSQIRRHKIFEQILYRNLNKKTPQPFRSTNAQRQVVPNTPEKVQKTTVYHFNDKPVTVNKAIIGSLLTKINISREIPRTVQAYNAKSTSADVKPTTNDPTGVESLYIFGNLPLKQLSSVDMKKNPVQLQTRYIYQTGLQAIPQPQPMLFNLISSFSNDSQVESVVNALRKQQVSTHTKDFSRAQPFRSKPTSHNPHKKETETNPANAFPRLPHQVNSVDVRPSITQDILNSITLNKNIHSTNADGNELRTFDLNRHQGPIEPKHTHTANTPVGVTNHEVRIFPNDKTNNILNMKPTAINLKAPIEQSPSLTTPDTAQLPEPEGALFMLDPSFMQPVRQQSKTIQHVVTPKKSSKRIQPVYTRQKTYTNTQPIKTPRQGSSNVQKRIPNQQSSQQARQLHIQHRNILQKTTKLNQPTHAFYPAPYYKQPPPYIRQRPSAHFYKPIHQVNQQTRTIPRLQSNSRTQSLRKSQQTKNLATNKHLKLDIKQKANNLMNTNNQPRMNRLRNPNQFLQSNKPIQPKQQPRVKPMIGTSRSKPLTANLKTRVSPMMLPPTNARQNSKQAPVSHSRKQVIARQNTPLSAFEKSELNSVIQIITHGSNTPETKVIKLLAGLAGLSPGIVQASTKPKGIVRVKPTPIISRERSTGVNVPFNQPPILVLQAVDQRRAQGPQIFRQQTAQPKFWNIYPTGIHRPYLRPKDALSSAGSQTALSKTRQNQKVLGAKVEAQKSVNKPNVSYRNLRPYNIKTVQQTQLNTLAAAKIKISPKIQTTIQPVLTKILPKVNQTVKTNRKMIKNPPQQANANSSKPKTNEVLNIQMITINEMFRNNPQLKKKIQQSLLKTTTPPKQANNTLKSQAKVSAKSNTSKTNIKPANKLIPKATNASPAKPAPTQITTTKNPFLLSQAGNPLMNALSFLGKSLTRRPAGPWGALGINIPIPGGLGGPLPADMENICGVSRILRIMRSRKGLDMLDPVCECRSDSQCGIDLITDPTANSVNDCRGPMYGPNFSCCCSVPPGGPLPALPPPLTAVRPATNGTKTPNHFALAKRAHQFRLREQVKLQRLKELVEKEVMAVIKARNMKPTTQSPALGALAAELGVPAAMLAEFGGMTAGFGSMTAGLGSMTAGLGGFPADLGGIPPMMDILQPQSPMTEMTGQMPNLFNSGFLY